MIEVICGDAVFSFFFPLPPPSFEWWRMGQRRIFRLENGLVAREVAPELIEEVFLIPEPVSYALDHFHLVIDAL